MSDKPQQPLPPIDPRLLAAKQAAAKLQRAAMQAEAAKAAGVSAQPRPPGVPAPASPQRPPMAPGRAPADPARAPARAPAHNLQAPPPGQIGRPAAAPPAARPPSAPQQAARPAVAPPAARPPSAPQQAARPASAPPAPSRPAPSAPGRPPTLISPEPPPGGKIPIELLRGKKIGRVLIKLGFITREQLQDALDAREKNGGLTGQILVDLGYITERQLNQALAAKDGIDSIDLEDLEIDPMLIARFTSQMCNTYKVLPFHFDALKNELHLAIDNPHNFPAIDDIQKLERCRVVAFLADPDQLSAALSKYYPEGGGEDFAALYKEFEADEYKSLEGNKSIDMDDIRTLAESNPVKKLLNLVLLQAIREHASDVHFEPFEGEFKMRYRIDGVLYEMVPPPRYIALAIASRIKVMANLDISERRLPQDGRIELTVQGSPVDLRVSVLPTMFGESVVMRVLDRSNVKLDLDRIGLREDDMKYVKQLISKPNGIVIVTGPTGSGKTTSLYAALNYLNDIETKLITTEDPVEYDIDGLVQCQMNEDIGLTFARCLRSILRQDPDIILVGEIRDLETAQIAVQASLTGHLVFSTLHTNDAPSAIARLVDLGLEPYLITATLEGIIAQRLTRRICVNCKTDYEPTEEQLMELDLRPSDVVGKKFFTGRGCESCNHLGYKGRQAIFEIMTFDDGLRDLIMKNASTSVLRNEARKRGMRTLRETGLLAIYDGTTTLEEVVRETIVDDA